MADESLKRLLNTIEAEEAEMQRYRARLAPRLRRHSHFRWLMPIGVAATAAIVLLIFLAWPRQVIFSPLDLDQVRAMASECSPEMLERARVHAREGNGESRWNANMLLCLVEIKDKATGYASRGLEADPRPEFRAAYLEFLLDNADEQRCNAAKIEDLMDRENDSICISLYEELYRVARMQEQYFGSVSDNENIGDAVPAKYSI